jgi:hypothetical protein
MTQGWNNIIINNTRLEQLINNNIRLEQQHHQKHKAGTTTSSTRG